MGKTGSSNSNDDRYQLESPRSPDRQVIPRRFPRIGSQFQTRISKSTEPLDRPIPDRMSAEYPHTTEYEVHISKTSGYIDENTENVTCNLTRKIKYDDSQHITSNRGGTIVHAPHRDMKHFKTFILPFVTSMVGASQDEITSQAWVQHMIHLHSTEGIGKRKRTQRGAVKRKRDNEEDLVWSLESLLQSQQEYRRRKRLPRMINGEEEATAMEYLGQRFGGNVQAAILNITADLSGGQATKLRKCGERKFTNQRSKVLSVKGSNHWRGLYERIAHPAEASLLAQLQDESFVPYISDEQLQPNETSHDIVNQQNTDIMLDSEDLKGAWTAILACGKSIERQMNGELIEKRKPSLSTILTFVGNAYRLPLPESCFGSQHVVIDEISSIMVSILQQIQKAQDAEARILDTIVNEAGDGIDSDALLKFLDECGTLPMKLPEIEFLYENHSTIVQWEARLCSLLDDARQNEPDESVFAVSLEEAEKYRGEAKSHGYLSKSLVHLVSRIQKAHDLRIRIVDWKNTLGAEKKGSLKTLHSFLKEIHRVKLGFAEASVVLEYHRMSQSWIDRANIAIRSKMSLSVIQKLIDETLEVPLDLSEYVDKLKIRVRTAEQWLDALEAVVPFKKYEGKKLEWLREVSSTLNDVDAVSLHELSSEGNRIPVVVDESILLQVAFDAKNWTMKAKKWTPCTDDSRKGKLSDLREHLACLEVLRDRLPLSPQEKMEWSPEGEKDILEIVDAADAWFDKHQHFLKGSAATSNKNFPCVSIQKLKEMVEEAEQIYVNMGPPACKVAKILSEAKAWYMSHVGLLHRCGLIKGCHANDSDSPLNVEQTDLEQAVQDAETNVSVEIQEAANLKKILEKTIRWRRQVGLIAPKRSKRSIKNSSTKLTISDLTSLVAESTELPINTDDEVHRLQIQLSTIEAWRSQVSTQLESIVGAFQKLQSRVLSVYGEAEGFDIEFYAKSRDEDDQTVDAPSVEFVNEKDFQCEESKADLNDELRSSDSGVELFRKIKDLQGGARDICVVTAEGELGDLLEAVATWCMASFKYLNDPKDVFNTRYFGAFDRFLTEGRDLLQMSFAEDLSENDIRRRVGVAWGSLVTGQLQRLHVLQRERELFKDWCRTANSILADETRLTADNILDLAEQSRRFPATTDLVSKVRVLSTKVEKWTMKVNELLGCGKKISVPNAQDLLEAGENLKVECTELKLIKEKLEDAQNWLNKVTAITSGEVEMNVNSVHELIKEHEDLIVQLPEEVEELRQAVVGYCLCRRPYEGFMIGCDHCEEWYHGSCIGVSESKAEKFEKFACVRCSMKEVFENSASAAAGLIRKWTCMRDLKKARQIDYQRIQRRFRKEKKDIEKYATIIEEAEHQLSVPVNVKDSMISGTYPCQISAPFVAANADTVEICGTALSRDQTSNGFLQEGHTLGEATVVPSKDRDEDVVPLSFETARSVVAPSCLHQPVPPGEANGIFQQTAEEINKSKKSLNKVEIDTKLKRAKLLLSQAQDRLEMISGQSRQRKFIEARENDLSSVLRRWMLHVRNEVLVPADLHTAERARPPFGVALSQPMKDAIQLAKRLGIADLPDISLMENHFKCMSWSLMALGFIRRKPLHEEVRYIIDTASDLNLPDERALRTLKFMASRASQIQSRCLKALEPKFGDAKPINLSVLQDIHKGAEELPISIAETKLLEAAIDDRGARHCICGGQNDDGLEMQQCGGCKKWFPFACVGRSAISVQKAWLCQGCGCKPATDRPNCSLAFTPLEPPLVECTTSPHAPDPKLLWPPFGLLGSKKAIEVLGLECSAILEENLKPKKETLNQSHIQGTNDASSTCDMIEGLVSLPSQNQCTTCKEFNGASKMQSERKNSATGHPKNILQKSPNETNTIDDMCISNEVASNDIVDANLVATPPV
ncbi:PLU-1-like protein [Nitzschia inconspicua]|uniref:PLU-1-like protein n=1 Tax=Nitzschia inconspicua TaxID=303405 RepID=A0A9K3Q7C0_9STRA|nr:PLU-1-like protein [Nitzschia inconspicua]